MVSYAPPGESEQDLLIERVDYSATLLTAFFFGIHFTLYLACAYALWRQRKDKPQQTWLFLAYITTTLILGTLYLVSAGRFEQLTYIDDRNYPGGPPAFLAVDFLNPIYYMSVPTYIITDWLSDGLLLWRCTIIWNDHPFRPILILPYLMYLASFVLGILSMVAVKQPFGLIASFNLTFPYFTISLALTVIVSALIVLRLVLQKRRMASIGGERDLGARYLSVAAMIVESAALYAIFALCFLITYVVNHPVQAIFLNIVGEVQIIAPLLIIYRVAQGWAWDSRTNAKFQRSMMREMEFASAPDLRTNQVSIPTTLQSSTINPSSTRIITLDEESVEEGLGPTSKNSQNGSFGEKFQ